LHAALQLADTFDGNLHVYPLRLGNLSQMRFGAKGETRTRTGYPTRS
jgi:hypothetical protein